MAWGLAEEAGFAAGWLSVRGMDGPAVLLAYLQSGVVDCRESLVISTTEWLRPDAQRLCPIALGAAISDFSETPFSPIGATRASMGLTAAPVLVVPFLAVAAQRTGHCVGLYWDGGVVVVGPGGIAQEDAVTLVNVAQAEIGIQAVSETVSTPVSLTTCQMDRSTAEALNSFAMKTTVPPSEKSRADAGAGESDND